MPNKENLIPITKRSKEEAKKIRLAGGKARGKQRTQEKTLKEKYNIALEILKKKAAKEIKDNTLKKILSETDILVFEQLKIILLPNIKKETKLRAIEYIQDRLHGKALQHIAMENYLHIDIVQIKIVKIFNIIKKYVTDKEKLNKISLEIENTFRDESE